MYIIKLGHQYLGELLPKIKLVDYREQVSKQCLFPDITHADGIINILHNYKNYRKMLPCAVHYTKGSKQFERCFINFQATSLVKWVESSKNRSCDICKIVAPSVKYLSIKSSHICPFCIQRAAETVQPMIEELPQEIKDDYYAILICNNLSEHHPIVDNDDGDWDDDIPF